MSVKRLICRVLAIVILCSGAIYPMVTPALAADLLNVTDTLSNYVAGSTADHTIAFTTASDIPQNGKIMIEFPQGFDISGVALGTLTVNGASSTFSLQPPSGQTVIVNQTGNSPVPGGSYFSLQLTGIVNTQTAGTYQITVTTTAANTKNTIDGPTVSADFAINSAAAATLRVTGYPSPVNTGESHSFSVTALDAFNNIAVSYNGTIQFTSSDPSANLPPDYTFVSSDNGSQMFNATFDTAGSQSITATDIVSANLTGTQSDITVSPVFTINTNSPLPDGTFGMNYAPVSLNATGGIPPYTWSIQNGQLPAGLSMSPGGIISGTPSAAGNLSTFIVQVTDNATIPDIAAKDFSITIDAATTSTALTSSNSSSAFGQAVTLTASVTSSAGIPTGPVSFYDGSNLLGNSTLDSSGQATFSTGSLSTGNHSLTAEYNGDANFASSTSTPITQSVGLAASATGLTSSLNPSTYGQSVTFTASVSSTAGIPTGPVSFYDSSNLLGNSTLDSSGQATFSTGSLSTGNHTITAEYSGDANFATSTSSPLTQSVGLASTLTGLASSQNPSASGQSVTFTASVSSTAGLPTGLVSFYDGSNLLGTDTLDSSGQATFSTSSLSTGNHSITAEYSGDANFATNTSTPLIQSVGLTSTLTGLTSSKNPSTYGQSVTFTASVSSTAGLPTGTVSFYDGSNLLGTSTLNSSGQAAFSTVSLSAGSHSITAVYSGDTNFASSTGTWTQTLGPAVVTPLVTVSNKTYDGTDSATINSLSLTGVIGGDNVSLTGGNAVFVSPDAGTGIPVNISGLSLTGNAAANYVLSSNTASTTADIALKSLTVSGITASDKVYDGTTAAAINTGNASLEGVISADSILLEVSSASGTFTNPDAGTGKVVNIAGLSISGSGAANYSLVQPTTTADIDKATPVITWTNPADIVYPTALGPEQLDATASVAGEFNYTPAAGTVLPAGTGQDLHVDFIPVDTLNFNDASADVIINVTTPTTTSTGGGGGGGGLGGLGGTSSGGGGGGGSDSTRTYLSGYMLGTPGVFSQNFYTKAYDGICNLFIPNGTNAKTAAGWALSYITLDPVPADKQTLPPPPGGNIVGSTYSLGPEGTTFNPPITIYMLYFPDKLPTGTNETDLVIGYWDTANQQWVPLSGCKVDTSKHTVTASISHFSTYALLSIPRVQPAKPPAPDFTLSDLTVSPDEVMAGQTITVSALVTNHSDTPASYTANLELNDQLTDTRSLSLAGNSSQTVTFVTTPDTAGIYTIKLNDLSVNVTINPPAATEDTPGNQTAPTSAPNASISPPAESPLSPANLSLQDLKLLPSQISPGGETNASVRVTNKGETGGDYTLTLKINGNITETRQVMVAGLSSQIVNFKLSQNQSGKYEIEINGLSAILEVSPSWPGWFIPACIALVVIIFISTLWFVLRRSRRSDFPFS